jgi:hypothetical protein
MTPCLEIGHVGLFAIPLIVIYLAIVEHGTDDAGDVRPFYTRSNVLAIATAAGCAKKGVSMII